MRKTVPCPRCPQGALVEGVCNECGSKVNVTNMAAERIAATGLMESGDWFTAQQAADAIGFPRRATGLGLKQLTDRCRVIRDAEGNRYRRRILHPIHSMRLANPVYDEHAHQ